jgi:hypothetical protein
MPPSQSVPLHFVVDTNVFIALEPGAEGVEPGLEKAAEFLKIARSQGHRVSFTQATRDDLSRDKSAARQRRNLTLLGKYPSLGRIAPSDELLAKVGVTRQDLSANPHDVADMEVLAALHAHAAGFMVTQDRRLLRWASRAGLDEWALTVEAAVDYLRSLEPKAVEPPPRVEQVKCYQLNLADEFFNSLKEDYPDFEDWWAKICQEQRPAWVIRNPADQRLEALLITKEEDAREIGLTGKALKACTFKVGPGSHGMSYGELLLKTLFKEAETQSADVVYCTAFEKQLELGNLLADFGFSANAEKTESGEQALVKHRVPEPPVEDDPLKAHIAYGPPFVSEAAPVFVVPIVPRWHELLFPDATLESADQESLPGLEATPRPYGNALRKAYISKSKTNQVMPGSVLAFYRSEDSRAIHMIGVVEQVFRSDSAEDILQRVARRTVYRPDDITTMLRESKRLHVMLFRQDRRLNPPWTYGQLKDEGVLKGAPQSITGIKEGGGLAWIRRQLTASR